jgi:hypothetical protein
VDWPGRGHQSRRCRREMLSHARDENGDEPMEQMPRRMGRQGERRYGPYLQIVISKFR